MQTRQTSLSVERRGRGGAKGGKGVGFLSVDKLEEEDKSVKVRRTGEEETSAKGEKRGTQMSERVASCGSLYDSTNLLLQYCNNGKAANRL